MENFGSITGLSNQMFQITIGEDMQVCISIATENIVDARCTEIDVRYEMIADYVIRNVVSIYYIPTIEIVADVITKALPKDAFKFLI